MPARVTVGLAGLFRGAPTLRRKWVDIAGVAAAFHRVRAAPWSARLPEDAPLAAAVAAVVVPARGRRATRAPVRLAGHPGVAAAVRAWTSLVGPAPLAEPTAPLLAVVGPPDVDAAVESAVERGERVIVVCDGQGDVIEPPPGGAWIDDPWAGEGGRGALGLGVLVAAGRSGVDVAAGLQGARAAVAAASRPLADNAAWSLARALRLAASDLGRDAVVHVATPDLLPLVRWAVGAQVVALAPASAAVPARPFPAVAAAGDLDWQAAVAASHDAVVVAWQAGSGGPESVDELAAAGVPVIRIGLAARDAETYGESMGLWLSALQALAALEQRSV